MRLPSILARRFVAGDTADDAIRAGQRLKARGIDATFDLLGEDVLDREAAGRIAEANKDLLRRIPDGVERNVSVKLTSLGLEVAKDFCLENTASILDVARRVKGFVRIDMEGSKHTQATLDVFHELRRTYDNVGIVLQAMLHRTEDDVKDAVRRGDRVRICKGAYKEPSSIAWQDMDDIRKSYVRCARRLLDAGHYPAIATHDEGLIREVLSHAASKEIPPRSYEFQMLYGLRPRRWDELVAAGHNVRIYVPYGTHWFPYFSRRLRERKENVFFVLESLIRG
ncbi:MAG TPA: proline dehydrogenase family protein [Vicinamibacteria bacterium]|nr:proline dehydrogenase family protein [Vicinamibacteria bacterium]